MVGGHGENCGVLWVKVDGRISGGRYVFDSSGGELSKKEGLRR